MHKIRNTLHKEILNSLVGIIAPGYTKPLSKRTIRKLCHLYKWNKNKIIKVIEDDEWWVHFCED